MIGGPLVLRLLRAAPRRARGRLVGVLQALRRRGPTELQFWAMAIFVGVAAGYAAIGFRVAIALIQTAIYGADDVRLHSTLAATHAAVVVGVPVLGGIAVGLILWAFTPDGRAHGVAQVIEAAALRDGRVGVRAGAASAAASLITLSTGGSTGREGPVVHIAATIASWISERIHASSLTARDLLGCAVAAAVSASFNAPIAGIVFALEVVLRHFALHAFAPIVLAAIAGTVVSRLHIGDVTEFTLPDYRLTFYQELPAFVLLGLVCGVVAATLIRAILFAERVADQLQIRLSLPHWTRPAAAGLILGLIALEFPHIIGVGYETTTRALTIGLPLETAIVFAVVKAAAVAITIGGRMGGGVFSPSLMMGALTGLAFGEMAVAMFPEISGGQGLYALAGLGAVAAAVLGAPISSMLIVLELTGHWQAGMAVMVSVTLASFCADRLGVKSIFLMQLMRDGLDLVRGPQVQVKRRILVRDLMRPRGADEGASDSACWQLHAQGAFLTPRDTLERALPLFDRLDGPLLPVMSEVRGGEPELLGAVFRTDVLRAYARGLEERLREEHS